MNLFNSQQCKGLAGFFFDTAKGLVLGAIVFAVVAPLETKLLYAAVSALLAYWCIKFALSLLENVK